MVILLFLVLFCTVHPFMHLLIIKCSPAPGCDLLTLVLSVTIVIELSLVVCSGCKSPTGGELK